MENLEQLKTIFNDIQECDGKTFASHLNTAVNICDDSFRVILNIILLCNKQIIPPKIILFLRGLFDKIDRESLRTILSYLLGCINSKSTKVRRNALKILREIVYVEKFQLNIGELQAIAEKLFDKESSVRKEAIKLCLVYQEEYLTKKLQIKKTIKDVVRFDQSPDVRKIGFSGINVDESTINCVIERAIDSKLSIRKIFWSTKFKEIDLKSIDVSQRIFLLKKAYNEREFDAKVFFNQCIHNFTLNEFLELFYCSQFEYDECLQEIIKNSEEVYKLDNFHHSYLHFIRIYYNHIENTKGRDSIELLPVKEFLEDLYTRCCDLETQKDEISENEIENSKFTIQEMFKIASFYDFFQENDKKYILSIIKKLLLKCNIKEIVEESIILSKRVCTEELINFLGSIIKKIREDPIVFVICEAILKHIDYCSMHDAILDEFILPNQTDNLNSIYFYLKKNFSQSLFSVYLSYLPKKEVIEGYVDLVLAKTVEIDDQITRNQCEISNDDVLIPISKLLLNNTISDTYYIQHLLVSFYITESEFIQQYLSIFLFEYFSKNPDVLIDIYCPVLEDIADNQRTFVDQSLFWICNSEIKNKAEDFMLKILSYVLNNLKSLKNRKYLFMTLEKIIPNEDWDKLKIKKTIWFLNRISRKRVKENIRKIMQNYTELDDKEALDCEIILELESKINE